MAKPIVSLKSRGIEVAVWEGRNGDKTYSIQKRYRDKKTDEWKESKYLFAEEAQELVKLLQQALEKPGDDTPF